MADGQGGARHDSCTTHLSSRTTPMPGSDACQLSTNRGGTLHTTAMASFSFRERNFKFPLPRRLERSHAARACVIAAAWYMPSVSCMCGVARLTPVNCFRRSYSVSAGSASSRSTAQLYACRWASRMWCVARLGVLQVHAEAGGAVQAV